MRKTDTSFQSQTCTACNVSACEHMYPEYCGAEGATIQAQCIERTAWYLRFIPVIFVVATAALLFYGFFIKTFDGYHPIPSSDEATLSGAFTRSFSAAPYHSTSQTPFEARHPYAVHRPSPLSQTAPFGTAGSNFPPAAVAGHLPPASAQRISPLANEPIMAQSRMNGNAVSVTEPLSPPPEQVLSSLSSQLRVVEVARRSESKKIDSEN